MRSFRSFSVALIVASLTQGAMPAVAQSQAPPTLDDAIAAIRAYAPRALAEQGAPGMSVAITDRTHTIAIIPVGVADVASKTPVTADTRFPIGSISKSMTALALLEQHDAGSVDLNAPVTRYLPWWSINGGNGILVHQLLSHTAGVPDDYTFAASYQYAIAALRDAHTLFPPGTGWSYSNDGFATAGAIVAQTAQRPWQDVIAAKVFAPIGMTNSSAYFSPQTLANAATAYIFRDADLVATPPNPALIAAQPLDFVDPAGSVISTPDDMSKYMRFYLSGGKAADGAQLLSPATFAAMTTADRLNDGKPAGAKTPELAEWPEFYLQYGFGLGVFNTDGDRLVGHTGGISGYTACMQANLTRGFGVVALSNLVEAPLHPCAIVKYAMAVLRAQSLGRALPSPPSGPPIAAPVIVAKDYVGTYSVAGGASVSVAARGADLVLNDGPQSYRLVPNGDDLFWTDDPRFPIYFLAFSRNKAKAVDSFTYAGSLYASAAYTGPREFTYPAQWNRYVGRYENLIWGSPIVMRVVVVKGQLTIDGIQPLLPTSGGAFALGKSVVRFDTPAGDNMKRMWLDGGDLYRVDLP